MAESRTKNSLHGGIIQQHMIWHYSLLPLSLLANESKARKGGQRTLLPGNLHIKNIEFTCSLQSTCLPHRGAARGGVRPRPTPSQSPSQSTGAGLCLKVVHTRRRWCVTFRRAGVCWRWDWCSSEHHFDGALRGFANDLRPGAPCTLTQKPHNFPRFNTTMLRSVGS